MGWSSNIINFDSFYLGIRHLKQDEAESHSRDLQPTSGIKKRKNYHC